MKVRECMCNNVTWVKPTDSVCNCAKLMSNNHVFQYATIHKT